jgi:hypothetical protein
MWCKSIVSGVPARASLGIPSDQYSSSPVFWCEFGCVLCIAEAAKAAVRNSSSIYKSVRFRSVGKKGVTGQHVSIKFVAKLGKSTSEVL